MLQFSLLLCLQPELGSPSHPQPRPWQNQETWKAGKPPRLDQQFWRTHTLKNASLAPQANGRRDETQQMFEAPNRSGDAQKTRQPGAYRRAAVLILASPTGLAGVGDLRFLLNCSRFLWSSACCHHAISASSTGSCFERHLTASSDCPWTPGAVSLPLLAL